MIMMLVLLTILAITLAISVSIKIGEKIEEKERTSYEIKFRNKLKSKNVIEDNVDSYIKIFAATPSKQEILYSVLDLAKEQDWGNLLTVIKGDVYLEYDNDCFVYIFEEGIYGIVKGNKTFIPKEKVLLRAQRDELSTTSEIYITNDNTKKFGERHLSYSRSDLYLVIDRNESNYESMEIFIKWYGDINRNRNKEIEKDYEDFIDRKLDLTKRYELYEFPYFEEFTYGHYIARKDNQYIFIGSNKENRSLYFEISSTVFDYDNPVFRFELPYEDIKNIRITGIKKEEEYLVREGYTTDSKWNGKKIAAGMILAGPVGAALMGQEKGKYVPSEYRRTTKDNRKIYVEAAEDIKLSEVLDLYFGSTKANSERYLDYLNRVGIIRFYHVEILIERRNSGISLDDYYFNGFKLDYHKFISFFLNNYGEYISNDDPADVKSFTTV